MTGEDFRRRISDWDLLLFMDFHIFLANRSQPEGSFFEILKTFDC